MHRRKPSNFTGKRAVLASASFGVTMLGGCAVDSGTSFDPVFLTANDLDLKIYFEPELMYAPVAAMENDDGTVTIVEPIYVPGGLAVARRDGLSLQAEDEADAREAAAYYCAEQGERPITGGIVEISAEMPVRVWQFQHCSP
ncbi:hypothetical protein [Paracoccus xiamenensis]|uniref:hypothetical protein n=1 Tax=Paracoccus xiamenensis TaxID=2714901 RepID=UPI00140A538E|nr:hypothetical protein [Paracoccus xiamenensis]NHF74163.1 hypothetical protein [Paracoccus xiamenensis]